MNLSEIMQNDEEMAIAAMHLLENYKEKLEELTEKDPEVAEIIAKARKMSDEEEFPSDNHDDENGTKDNVAANVDTLRNKVTNLLKPVGDLILNEEALKTLPENVRLGVEAMGVVIGNRRGLKAELVDSENINSHRNCCCCMISYNYFSDRYYMSVAAEAMLVTIKEIIGNEPGSEDVTRPERRGEMKAIPTNLAELKSRNELFEKIIKALASKDVNALGVFGMGGSGKTTLAIQVANSKAKSVFETAVMVEISESPNIESIQNQIGDGLDLDLNNVHGIREKAIRLHNRLTPKDESDGRKDEKKILVVLDNIWKKIDLDQIGIPRKYCKLLLTSRTKDVCKEMDVEEGNILEVGLLSKDEAKDLFKFQVQKVVTMEYKSVVDRLLKKCRGLPISIVATATSLKGKELPFWRQFAEELEKPISCQISGVHHETFSILRTSYEVMASEEKKKFFLLACLSPVGTSISIDNLMRYGIGLDLFQHVNKLSEAIDLARTWAQELVSSSMLLKADSDEYVKIHDVVRESTMSFAPKSGINTDGHMFLVDAIPRWICEETFNKYTGISLLAQANYVPLTGVKADLLQILLLKGNSDRSSFLVSNFFQGMTNLKVLEMLFMNFEIGLPESIGKLKALKTLHLVDCKLGDIKLIGELGSLLVLSLRGSSLEGLPDEIGKLYKLRLLDMSKCQCKEPRIPANVIAKLSLLEGLYLGKSNFTEWAVIEGTSNDTGVSNGADIEDLTELEFLNVLEIEMRGPISLPIGTQFVENLDKFQIIVGQDDFELQPSQSALMVSELNVSQELEKDNCLKELLKEADFLALRSATVSNIVPELDKEGYRDLSRLELSNIDSMSRICEGKAPTELFYNLCHLAVSKLENLEVLLPVNPLPLKMTTLGISDCNSLKYIFSEDDVVNKESDIIKLPCLKTLELDGVSNLISFVEESNNDDCRRPSFFNNKVALTSLEKLSLGNNMRIVKLWDKESNLHSFQNLKNLQISECGEMESIGLWSMFLSLVQLEILSINSCKKMQRVISDGSETQQIPKEIIPFPKLKSLDIQYMENLECFYDGSCKMAFPSLETLKLTCELMTKFAGGTSSTAFFPKTIEFPSLESLWLFELSDEVRVLWDLPVGEGQGISSNPLPNLKTLYIRKIKLPSIVFPSLSYLTVEDVGDTKFLFSSSSENEGCVGTFSQFPKLEQLRIQGCPGLRKTIY
ncbi:putative disease resistance protein At4g27220 [Silene latifolia]|uniref:putative disease resistance protein At4g27220 n=1 Tax=Silene latifolia TaxID=37657 RepID=UPI003D76C56B